MQENKLNHEPIFCSLAFGSVSINSTGQYIPCCNIVSTEWSGYKELITHQDPAKKINSKSLMRLRSELSSGVWPKVCSKCRDSENNGADSMRTIWNKSLKQHNIPIEEKINPNNIRFLDLTFGTKCNSKCMTCSPGLSDFWEEEHRFLTKNVNLAKRTMDQFPKRISISDHDAELIIRSFPNVEYIAFVGGEPTISNEHLDFLRSLIKLDRSKNIGLSYVTNLTGISDELTNLWSNFKEINLSVSIDGYDKVNEYIRYPFRWKKIVTNLSTIFDKTITNATSPVYSVGLSYTPSIFNAGYSGDFFEYWYSLLKNYPNSNGHLIQQTSCYVNKVYWPEYANMLLLPNTFRDKEISKIDNLLKKIDNDQSNGVLVNKGLIDSLHLLKIWLGETQIHSNSLIKELKSFIIGSDEFRNRDIKDYLPELWDEILTI